MEAGLRGHVLETALLQGLGSSVWNKASFAESFVGVSIVTVEPQHIFVRRYAGILQWSRRLV